MRAIPRLRSRIAAALCILVGIYFILIGVTGLGLVLSEYFWPNSRPVRPTMARLGDQLPNLVLMFAIPGGFVLLRRGQNAFRRP